MDQKEAYIYKKWCLENKITIYPKPVTNNGSRCKIVINRNGKEKIGSEIYEVQKTFKEVEIQTPSGMKKVKQVIPPLYEKIEQLYKDTYFKNQNKIE
ncbi:hypothetical protein LXD69_07155 [Flavobacterium sediminilitoris]|uniref:Uncharacterized protein n=1 Tax=Flavobacterium sediminilitoris TaxID=2024526 RepID=A0ABY4HRU0_9FLAO|nr:MULTISPECIES: hypothetical protein [Flavobacterium]UOX35288.1 hypothetical protein LXD69_07155 [Flavobacterium sediminilitoris]